MRLYEFEKEALKEVFKDFEGEIYIFGSRVKEDSKGGDIDIILKTDKNLTLEDILKYQSKYFLLTDTNIDIVKYRENDPFIKEVMNDAERLDLSSL
ncbi:nucleotidyltransferase domain-containing protein [Sulfurihydrogenibium azorense]|jgi:predicted nucleotidyltransferase|uniref:Putative nucleotidyltransferase domain protein n=1 Tax=Sulfurihydrogenibium azorense (strain DSM 15241 / OCM 825 / Az-Fu1) TaxID=204536 RepID=C1DVW9_SULAA|nr:nucleotidyltransferase domain-containing protein [Sulfurihydrogenibium azorense]ACN98345.1 putative nucleotidyltransferase domain protein [Sulfurihydrogenibium azorense Az-Fu1]MDM7273612.1 nucleotidyltransferase domain-containing protein [Sulfurihydrogenibium azorense]